MTATLPNISAKSPLPARPSLEHLRKEAKHRLAQLRTRSAAAQLADAQLLIAREYGFSSWRALKAAVDESGRPVSRPPLNHHRVASSYIAVRDGVRSENMFFNCIALVLVGMFMVMTVDIGAHVIAGRHRPDPARVHILR